jgi:predicted ATPase with chaperone activity
LKALGSFGIASITQSVTFLRGAPTPPVDPVEVMGERAGRHANRRLDLADVAGQVEAKSACEVAELSQRDSKRLGVRQTMPKCSPPGRREYVVP